jgi:hypothetical protein
MARDGWPERLQVESTHGAFIGAVRDALATARALLAFLLGLLLSSEQSHASPFGTPAMVAVCSVEAHA